VPRGQRDGSLLPYSRCSRQEPLFFYQVAPHLYSRGWVDPVWLSITSYDVLGRAIGFRGVLYLLKRRIQLQPYMLRNQCLPNCGRFNVWVSSLGDQLLRSAALLKRLTRTVYHRFLVNDLSIVLQHVPAHHCQHVWLTHDEATNSFSLHYETTREWDFRCIAHNMRRPVNLSARFPTGNPLQFSLWELPKPWMNWAPIDELEVLQKRLQNSC
jgi:hypothetical protein